MENVKTNLSKRKQGLLDEAIKQAVAAGVQYNVNYVRFEKFSAKIDNDEKRNAVKFLLDEVLDLVELDYRMAPIVMQLGNPTEKESLSYREFKLLQEIIKNLKLRGRDNLSKLVKSMQAFNEDGRQLDNMEQESQIFIKEYQKASSKYAQLCKEFGIMPEDLQQQIETETEAKLKELADK